MPDSRSAPSSNAAGPDAQAMPLPQPGAWQLLLIFLRLGCTSFGGPVAHLAYFRDEFVQRRRWFSDAHYAELVALCQFLPGPASSQVGIGIGFRHGGYRGAIAAWLGFTLPSVILLIAFALSMSSGQWLNAGALQGLKIIAVAVVLQACWGMAQQLCPDAKRQVTMLLAACVALLLAGMSGQLLAIALGGMLGFVFMQGAVTSQPAPATIASSRRGHIAWLLLLLAILLLLPVWRSDDAGWIALIDVFFRTGTLVFGGGHVVLPLLQAEVVPQWVSATDFMAGYGAAQAVPGPLFTFAAFLGSLSTPDTSIQAAIGGGLLAVAAIFLPSFLLMFGVLPLWQGLQKHLQLRAALLGINAAVVGLLLAALYDPIWTSTIHDKVDMVWLLSALTALRYLHIPVWLAVISSALLGAWWL